jgi:hypothetical protein
LDTGSDLAGATWWSARFVDCTHTRNSVNGEADVNYRPATLTHRVALTMGVDHQVEEDKVRFVADPYSERTGLYELDLSGQAVEKVTQLLHSFSG